MLVNGLLTLLQRNNRPKEKDSGTIATENMINRNYIKKFVSTFKKQGHRVIDSTSINTVKSEMVKNNLYPQQTTEKQLDKICPVVSDKVAKDFDGQPVPMSNPPPHKLPQYSTDPFMKKVIEKAKEVEKSKEVQPPRLPSRIELDEEAIQSQLNYRQHTTKDGHQWSIYNRKMVYPTGCSDKCIRNMIARENVKRIEIGKKPFLTYDEFVEFDKERDNPKIPGVTYLQYQSPNSISKQCPQYIVKEKYYLMRERGTTFVFNNCDGRGASVKRCLRLQKHTNSDEAACGSKNSIKHSDQSNPLVDISQNEHDNILSSKPSLDNLLNAYVLVNNDRPKFMDESDISNLGTEMNFSLTQNIF